MAQMRLNRCGQSAGFIFYIRFPKRKEKQKMFPAACTSSATQDALPFFLTLRQCYILTLLKVNGDNCFLDK